MNPESRSRLALAWIWLIAAWVLAGATFKLFWGTPTLLPEVIRDLPLELGLTYNLAIGIELAIAGVAFTKPRWGWWMQAALLVVFDLVLTTQIAAGETNCGCFGSKLSVDPRVMLALDSVFLAGLLALRPWSCLGPGLPALAPIALATLAALAMLLPWIFDRQADRGGLVANGKPVEGEWIDLRVEDWVGKDIWDTPLGRPPLNQYIDVMQLPLSGVWVFWRATCDHCAKHLAEMAETEHGEREIALIQLEEKNDTLANLVVHSLPDGNFVKTARLPPSISYVIQTPAELVLDGGKIVSAQEAVDVEK